MIRSVLFIMIVAGTVVSAISTFYNNHPLCRAKYCSSRNGYCSADCCECLCNHNHMYYPDLDSCELPPTITPTTESTTVVKTSSVSEGTTRTTAGNFITQPPSGRNETGIPTPRKTNSGNAGLIAGSIVGVITVLVVLFVVAIFCYRKKTRRKSDHADTNRANPTAPKGSFANRDTFEDGNVPIYAYADLSPNIGTSGRTISSSSKASILPRASPDLRYAPMQEPYDYTTDSKSYRPPIAPRPVSCSDLQNKRLIPESPRSKSSHPTTIARSSNLACEVGKSPPSRRAAPVPPIGSDEIAPIYHVLDNEQSENSTYSALNENDKEPDKDELYEQPSAINGQGEEGEDPYRELTYAHSPGVYEALGTSDEDKI